MSFKPKTAEININLDMSDYALEGDPKGDILPKKVPKVDAYIVWSTNATDILRDKDEEEKLAVPEYAIKRMISQIDYWYEKGEKWWKDRCTFPVLNELLSFITDQVGKIQKK